MIFPALLCLAALIVAFLTLWIVVPAPTRALLPLAVGAPELSPWLLLAGLVLCALTWVVGRGRATARVAFACSAIATLLALIPVVQVPFVVRRFDDRMQSAIAVAGLRPSPALGAPPRSAPVVLSDLLFGINPGPARVIRALPFAAPEGVPLTLDVYRPVQAGRYPSVVQVYGGAWQRGAPGDDAPFATYLASRGYVVFAIDYRHAPRWQWPAQLDDVRAAMAWVRGHGSEYGADVSRIVLLGRSAGAHLAMLAAYDPAALAVRGVVSFYGPVDLVEGYRRPPRPDPLDVRAVERALFGGSPDDLPERYRAASPIAQIRKGLPPSLLIYGRRDHIVLSEFGARLDQRLRASGNTSIYLEIPWAEHAFDGIGNGLSGQLSLYYTERFLAWAVARE
jgi:acetyl esterase/lipase